MNRRDFDKLFQESWPLFAEVIDSVIADFATQIQVDKLEAAIARGNPDDVFEMLFNNPAVFAPIQDIMQDIVNTGGSAELATVPALRNPDGPGRLAIRFDGRNPRAEAIARNQSSKLVTLIREDARAAIRDVISDGIETGTNPRETALRISGSINRTTGRRQGGIVGLNRPQAKALTRANYELTDPGLMRQYLQRDLRDRRFDSIVQRAIDEEMPLSNADRKRILRRYSDRLLAHRGEMIARTETLASLNAGRAEGMEQLIQSGAVDRSQVTKRWSATFGGRTRDSHGELHGTKIPFDENFISPATGRPMAHPGDSTQGAEGEDVINCRCHMSYKVDYLKPFR